MKNYIGFGWSCGSFAVDNAVKKLPISAELYEIIGGVPFGVKHDENIILTQTDPFDGILISGQNIGMDICRKTYMDFDCFWDSLFSDYSKDKYGIVIGPVNMRKLYYIPFSSFYSDVDHFLAVKRMNATSVCISDSDGFEYITITKEQASKMFNAEEKFNDNVNFCYYLIERDFSDIDWAYTIHNLSNTIVKNFSESQKELAFTKAGEYAINMMNAKEVNNMLFHTNSLMYRKQLQKDFLLWYNESGFGSLHHILPFLDQQLLVIAKQKYYLKKYKTDNHKWCWEELQTLENTICELFIDKLAR